MLKKLIAAAVVACAMTAVARAEVSTPHSGMQVVQTSIPFNQYSTKLQAAVRKHGMTLVGVGCASCGARSLGVIVPGNRVFMIFNRYFATQVLKASTAASIEAPIRLLVTENSVGHAVVTYRLPSHTFGEYGVPALDSVGKHLDVAVTNILNDVK